jgi:hypothetical protein
MSTAMGKSRSRSTAAADPSRNLGLAMAVISTVFGFLYLLGLVANLATTGAVHSSSEPVQFLSATIAILWDQVLVILFVTIRRQVPESKKLFAELALVFVVLLSATSSVNWFARLTIVPRIAQAGDASLLALVDPYSESSIMFAMEHLAWGLFFGLAALFAASAMGGGRLGSWLRWLLVAGGVLSLLHAAGLIVSQPVLSFLGYPAWGLLLPITTLLLAVRFRRGWSG